MKPVKQPQINWQPIATAPHNKFILVACEGGSVNVNWVYVVARYQDDYHDRWDDEGNDALMDGGYIPSYWAPLPNEPPPLPAKPTKAVGQIQVCGSCLRACCWQGEFYCDQAKTVNTVYRTKAELEELKLEHPSYWETDEELANE